MYLCFRGIDFVSFRTIFLLQFGRVANVWYFFFFILLTQEKAAWLEVDNLNTGHLL